MNQIIKILFMGDYNKMAKLKKETKNPKKGTKGWGRKEIEIVNIVVSSGLEKCQEIINHRFHPDAWNIYVFQTSDGDNWSHDMSKTLVKASELMNVSQMFCYIEVIPQNVLSTMLYTDVNSRLSINYQQISNQKFKMVQITRKEEIWPSFKELFGAI